MGHTIYIPNTNLQAEVAGASFLCLGGCGGGPVLARHSVLVVEQKLRTPKRLGPMTLEFLEPILFHPPGIPLGGGEVSVQIHLAAPEILREFQRRVFRCQCLKTHQHWSWTGSREEGITSLQLSSTVFVVVAG